MNQTQELSPVAVRLGPDPSRQDYLVHFRPLRDIPELLKWNGLRPATCVVVTDENVDRLFREPLEKALREAGWHPHTVVVPAGEDSKSFACLQHIYDTVLPLGIDRKTPLLAIGGGVVGDLAGLAAATLLRGIPLIQIPTTLIAQVDSAIGGKTGINHGVGKNLIGAFHQPLLVCSDLTTLQSLSEREWTGGLAEVVKHGLIADAELFDYLIKHWEKILSRDPRAVAFIVQRSAAIKARVVGEDEREGGIRAVLNFGHTFGHALERITGYGHFSHGEAVAVGMIAALHLSYALRPTLPLDKALNLVTRIPTAPMPPNVTIDELISAMYYDKKIHQGKLRFVVLDSIGKALVTNDVDDALLRSAWEFAQRIAVTPEPGTK